MVFSVAGAIFAENALQRIASAFASLPSASCVYGDVDVVMNGRAIWPLALRAFDYERLLEQGYAANLFALRTVDALAALALSGNLYRIMNSVFDGDISASGVIHMPGALAAVPFSDPIQASGALVSATQAHLKRRGVAARVEQQPKAIFPSSRVQRLPEALERTCIVIPTRNRFKLLKACVDSIRQRWRGAARKS